MAGKILAFAGSTRKDSYNKVLIRIAAEGARAAGAEVTLIDLRDYPMPVYDGDFEAEQGLHGNAKVLKRLFLEHSGLLIAAPEYNSSISGVLKNAIDWVSRPEPGEANLAAFDGKIAGIMSASPGRLGGLRGLAQLRHVLGNIKVLVIPEQIAISTAHEAFGESGALKDEAHQEAVIAIGAKVAHLCERLGRH